MPSPSLSLCFTLFSFMEGFSQRPPKPNDMGTVVHTFIDLVLDKMETHTLWANSSREEFEEAYDAIEKLVVVKLYNLCASFILLNSCCDV